MTTVQPPRAGSTITGAVVSGQPRPPRRNPTRRIATLVGSAIQTFWPSGRMPGSLHTERVPALIGGCGVFGDPELDFHGRLLAELEGTGDLDNETMRRSMNGCGTAGVDV